MKDLNKTNPFKTPEGYFEGFNDGLMDRLSEEKLDIPKKEGFTVPENYFDGLHNSIQEKLDTKETKVIQLHPYRKYYVAAASIAAILLLFFGLNWSTAEEPSWDDLASEDIEAYFETYELGLSSYEIAEELPVDELEISKLLETQFNEENVLEYLDQNIDDFDELNLEDYE